MAQLEFFYGFPAWLVAFWAIAVWGGVLGAVLLLMRRKLAFPVLTVSLFSMVVTAIHNFGFSGAAGVMGTFSVVFTGIIFVVALGLALYSRRMAAAGVLK